MGDICNAADVATIERVSGSFTLSTDRIVTTTWTSLLKLFGKSGRIDRSISLPERIASSDGLPSLFTQRDPLILPPA
ncbi:MAG: hypothetical protein ACD_37C00428G0003 [uncultured bacterium]|nr:MAG: hypothetical protein ACD_37C00428G0003 [uncultured bacterium]